MRNQVRVEFCCIVRRPEAFAALREIEDAMRIIEKAELPMNAQALTTFNNTFWEPQAKASSMIFAQHGDPLNFRGYGRYRNFHHLRSFDASRDALAELY